MWIQRGECAIRTRVERVFRYGGSCARTRSSREGFCTQTSEERAWDRSGRVARWEPDGSYWLRLQQPEGTAKSLSRADGSTCYVNMFSRSCLLNEYRQSFAITTGIKGPDMRPLRAEIVNFLRHGSLLHDPHRWSSTYAVRWSVPGATDCYRPNQTRWRFSSKRLRVRIDYNDRVRYRGNTGISVVPIRNFVAILLFQHFAIDHHFVKENYPLKPMIKYEF